VEGIVLKTHFNICVLISYKFMKDIMAVYRVSQDQNRSLFPQTFYLSHWWRYHC